MTMLVGGGCFVAANEFNKLGLIRSIPVTGQGNVPGIWECGVINGSPDTIIQGGVSMEAKAICLVTSGQCSDNGIAGAKSTVMKVNYTPTGR